MNLFGFLVQSRIETKDYVFEKNSSMTMNSCYYLEVRPNIGLHHPKADDSNANLVEPKGTALYGGEWREQGEDAAVGAGDPGGEEEIVLLNEVNGLAAENEEKQSGIITIGQADYDFCKIMSGLALEEQQLRSAHG